MSSEEPGFQEAAIKEALQNRMAQSGKSVATESANEPAPTPEEQKIQDHVAASIDSEN